MANFNKMSGKKRRDPKLSTQNLKIQNKQTKNLKNKILCKTMWQKMLYTLQ